MSERYLFTSESVTEGHPDKVADQISDAVLDSILAQDPKGRVACECFVTTGLALVGGEITTDCWVDIPDLVRKTVRGIGYDHHDKGFESESIAIISTIDKQSGDIAMGVDKGGAGDQGLMFGYAIDETPQLMPLAITLAHQLTAKLSEVRRAGLLKWLRPDGKSQVTIEYLDGVAARIDAVVVSTQHDEEVTNEEIRREIIAKIIEPIIPANMRDANTKYHINPTGRFVSGGPHADTGLTGRKIIVDTYGGSCPHGGGAFSGKDATKVDRSASYYARYVAKNVVASGLAKRCQIQVAYAIGVADPVSVMVDTFGTGKLSNARLSELVRQIFHFKPLEMIEELSLRRPIFQKTAAFGHFGRELPEFFWERTDKAAELLKNA